MLSENLKTIRKNKGLSQAELAVKLNVVRQTVSKWEQGLSVPDADMLIALSDALGTPVSVLLGETVTEVNPSESNELKKIAEKLEVVNLQLARRKDTNRKVLHVICILLCAGIAAVFVFLGIMGSPYLAWNYGDPETAVIGAAYHMFEWVFVRLAPLAFAVFLAGAIFTRKKV